VEEREQRLIEYSVEAVIVGWLAYLFFYQNFLLYNWHRGLPLPSKWPSAVLGVVSGVLFFWYEWMKFEGKKSPPEVAPGDASPREP